MTWAQHLRRAGALLAVAAVAIGIDVAAADGKGAWLIAGVAIGFGLIGHLPFLTPDRPRSETLPRTLAPLLLPLLVVAMIGTYEQAKWIQLVAGIAGITLGWALFVVPEAPRTKLTLTWERGVVRKVAKLGFRLVLIAGVPAFLVWLLVRDSTYLRDRGGPAGFLFLGAVFLWVGVAILRLVAYSRSWARVVVAALLLCTLAALAVFVGALPGDESPATIVPTLVLAGAAVVAWLVAWFVDDGPDPLHGALPQARADVFASLGLGAALVASAALALAALSGLIRTADPGIDRNAPKLARLDPVAVRAVPRIFTRADSDLAATYYPVLALTVHQRWAPMPVEEYLPDVTMSGPGDEKVVAPTLDQLPKSCPRGTGDACYTLSVPNCHEGEPSCAPDTDFNRREGRSVYVRVQRLTHGVPLRPPYGQPGKPLTTIVQYWFFYRYDRWTQRALAGRLTQEHQGDWENVTLGFAPREEPLFVAYSAHCAGTVLPWNRVPIASVGGPRTHPLVGVAEGSQANYPRVKQAHVPDWIGCQGRPKGLLSLVSYSSNVRDLTEYGRLWYPTELIPAQANKPPMSFPGTWGEDDRTTVKVSRTRTLDTRRGPASPPLQPLWIDPLEAIFCGDYKGAKCMHR